MPNPYPCQNLNGLQIFNTDGGVQFAMGFTNISHHLSPVLGIYDIRVYSFDFFSDRHAGKDDRVAPTILGAVQEFFTDPNRVMAYVCDTSDGRAAERQRLFTRWTRNLDEVKQARIEIGDDIHAGILMRKDFQHWDVLRDELFHSDRGIGRKFE